MRIVLTGGAGYIGMHTLTKILAEGHDVLVIDNFVNSTPEALDRVRMLSNSDFTVCRADIRDRLALNDAFSAFRPEAVIHFAGLKGVGEGETHPLSYYDTNISGTITLLEAMNAVDCRTIIFSSSAAVYGEPKYLPVDEKHQCRPISVYGRTKLMAEQILSDWCNANAGTSNVMLRYFNPVGAHESGLIGEDPRDVPSNLVPFLAQVAIGRQPELVIYGDDYPTRDGTGLRDFIHVVDLASAHLAALHYANRHRGTEVFNVGTGTGYTVREMLDAFSRSCGRTLPHRTEARRSGDIVASYADTTKAERVMGWRAERGLDDMCASAWRWQSANPEGYNTS